jgi:hypothetical protein
MRGRTNSPMVALSQSAPVMRVCAQPAQLVWSVWIVPALRIVRLVPAGWKWIAQVQRSARMTRFAWLGRVA